MPGLTPEQRVAGVRALLGPRSIAIVGASDRPGNWSMRVFQHAAALRLPGPDLSGESAQQDGLGRRDLLPEPRRPAGNARPCRDHRAGRRRDRHHRRRPARSRRAAPPCSPAASARAAIPRGARSARSSASAIEQRRPRGVGPELPRQSGGAAPHDDHPRRPHRRARARPGRHRRPERRHRDGDPARAARARRHDRLRDHQRQRDRPTHRDYIRYLADDPDMRGDRLLHRIDQACGRVQSAPASYARDAGKPVVAVKIGGSEESRKAALAHTGSLAGSLQCFDAVAETDRRGARRYARRSGRDRRVFHARGAAEGTAARRA